MAIISLADSEMWAVTAFFRRIIFYPADHMKHRRAIPHLNKRCAAVLDIADGFRISSAWQDITVRVDNQVTFFTLAAVAFADEILRHFFYKELVAEREQIDLKFRLAAIGEHQTRHFQHLVRCHFLSLVNFGNPRLVEGFDLKPIRSETR